MDLILQNSKLEVTNNITALFASLCPYDWQTIYFCLVPGVFRGGEQNPILASMRHNVKRRLDHIAGLAELIQTSGVEVRIGSLFRWVFWKP